MAQRGLCVTFLAVFTVGWMAQAGGQSKKKPPLSEAKNPVTAPSPYAPRFTFGGNAAEVPATFNEELVFFPVNINGSQPSLFVVDTTASETSIDPKRAQELGLSPNQPDALVLPGVMFPLSSLPEIGRADFSADTGRLYQGTIGNDLLSRAVVAIDYARETVRIFAPDSYKYTGNGSVLPLSMRDGTPVIRARFSTPKGKQVEADFGIDTAVIAGVVISRKFSEAHHTFPKKGKTAQGFDPQLTGGENVSLFRLRYFKIGKSSADDPIAEVSSSKKAGTGDPTLAGVIGGRLLRRFNVVFDYPHKQIMFEANENFGNYDEEDKSGIALIASGPGLKTLEVAHVVPHSPAADAGIQAGDVIEGIDGEAAADISLASARDMFRQVGYKYKLLVQHGGQTKEVTLQTQRLL